MKHIQSFTQHTSLNESEQVEEIDPTNYDNKTVPALPFNNEVKGDKEAFLKKLTYISEQLGAKPEWFMICIAGESGFNPQAVNPDGGATGLIQFMPNTIKGYLHPKTKRPMTTDDLKNMSAVDQLDVVYAYYKAAMKQEGIDKFDVPGDFFGITFYPKIVKEPMTFNFPPNAIKQNKSLFDRIGGTTKQAYYDYCQKLVNDPEGIRKAIKNFDGDGFFGKNSGGNTDFFSGIVDELRGLVGNIITANVTGS